MSYWAKPALDRDQLVLIETTLSDRIPEDHTVRLFLELLDTYDWGPWERTYCGCAGQPGIHPRTVASVVLYGLTQGIRSSRKLEWATVHAVDFMWLAEGRRIDHSTFCGFRRRFGAELKDLFRHLGRLAMAMGVVRLNCVAIDGTRVAANGSRHGTRSVEGLEAALAGLDEQIERMLSEAETVDRAESERLFDDESPITSVPKELASAQARQAKLKQALAGLKARQSAGSTQKKISPTDPDAPILPNKTGGFAPNYTPVVATDATRRFIVAETVHADAHESDALGPLLAQTDEAYGQSPETLVADSGFCTEENLKALADHPTDAYLAPANERLEGSSPTPSSASNVAHRPDPRVAVASSDYDALPRTRQGRLRKDAFVYDTSADCFWCPMGRSLPFLRLDQEHVKGRVVGRRVYACRSCQGCPLRSICTDPNRNRRIRSRGSMALREHMAKKVHTPEGREIYRQRQSVAESPFGIIKTVMGVRQFLLRGVNAVRTEWRWITTAYDLRILVNWLKRQRQMIRAVAG